MQPIERYGLVALVFLGITISAAYFWEPDSAEEPQGDAPASLARNQGAEPGRRDFVGARTNPATAQQGKGLSAAQRQELLALQGRKAEQDRAAKSAAQNAGRRNTLGDAFAPVQTQPVQTQPDPQVADPGTEPAPRLEVPREQPAKSAVVATPRASKPAATTGARLYTIQASDTLSEIAMNELGTWKRWQEIVDLNPGLDPNSLKEGARIKLPAGGNAAASSPAPTESGKTAKAASAPAAGPLHVVQRNESLWKIAATRLGDGERWKEIADLNPKINPDKLTVGMKLVLPASAARRSARDESAVAQAEPRKTTGKVR